MNIVDTDDEEGIWTMEYNEAEMNSFYKIAKKMRKKKKWTDKFIRSCNPEGKVRGKHALVCALIVDAITDFVKRNKHLALNSKEVADGGRNNSEETSV